MDGLRTLVNGIERHFVLIQRSVGGFSRVLIDLYDGTYRVGA
jgi:hypothetical protein